MDCSRLAVPVDWAHPGGPKLTLALRRHHATGTRKGSLVLNPGGPGGSGVEFLPDAVAVFGKDLVAAYDLISWDPRGVGGSSPLTCPAAANAALAKVDASPDTLAERTAQEAATGRWAHACATASGPLFGHVDTISTARDLDAIRVALGEKKLNYGGFSYGTRIGLFYADLFPRRVGRMLLDSTVDPANDDAAFLAGQTVSLDRALTDYLTSCRDRAGCPLRGVSLSVARQRIAALIKAADAPGGVRQEDIIGAVTALLTTPKTWPALDTVLTGLLNGDTNVLELYQGGAGPDVANLTINCMDLPDSRSGRQVLADAARAARVNPVLGWEIASGPACPQWPTPAVVHPHLVTAAGAAPILVVGTTRDSATPFEWAVSTASHLSSGRLLTRVGSGHVAYSRNACVTAAVDRYFIDGRLPAEGAVCRD
ncbi:alpha/beta hydrolase [Cryptosporangium sp. NPDC051539]|uniref:alpha/beta hydrolase n=1 Tax=Cryptosporangium sp. NPDC051539 TaxID=3363962 RepID=UPI0037BB3D45